MHTYANDVETPKADDFGGGETIYGAAGPGGDRPQNDGFSAALPVSGVSGRTAGDNFGTTTETDEPGQGTGSVWWRWRDPANGTVTIGSDFDTFLGVYSCPRRRTRPDSWAS